MNAPLLHVGNVSVVRPGAREPVVTGISFDVFRGEVVAVVGPSGVGKSTLLFALAGLMRPSTGVVVTHRPAIVFQDSALFPWLSVEQNVLFALRFAGFPRAERPERARELLRKARLAGHGHKHPHELSGGMKKRAAFARALATSPEVLLLDEPFSALDPTTRRELHDELRVLFVGRGVGVVLVTHDIDEAVALADRALVLGGCPGEIRDEVVVRDHPSASGVLRAALARAGREEREEDHDEARATVGDPAFGLGARVVGAR